MQTRASLRPIISRLSVKTRRVPTPLSSRCAPQPQPLFTVRHGCARTSRPVAQPRSAGTRTSCRAAQLLPMARSRFRAALIGLRACGVCPRAAIRAPFPAATLALLGAARFGRRLRARHCERGRQCVLMGCEKWQGAARLAPRWLQYWKWGRAVGGWEPGHWHVL